MQTNQSNGKIRKPTKHINRPVLHYASLDSEPSVINVAIKWECMWPGSINKCAGHTVINFHISEFLTSQYCFFGLLWQSHFNLLQLNGNRSDMHQIFPNNILNVQQCIDITTTGKVMPARNAVFDWNTFHLLNPFPSANILSSERLSCDDNISFLHTTPFDAVQTYSENSPFAHQICRTVQLLRVQVVKMPMVNDDYSFATMVLVCRLLCEWSKIIFWNSNQDNLSANIVCTAHSHTHSYEISWAACRTRVSGKS